MSSIKIMQGEWVEVGSGPLTIHTWSNPVSVYCTKGKITGDEPMGGALEENTKYTVFADPTDRIYVKAGAKAAYALITVTAENGGAVSRTLPIEFFGLNMQQSRVSNFNGQGPWQPPPWDITSIRLFYAYDGQSAGTTNPDRWLYLEASDGVFDFAAFDGFCSQFAGKNIKEFLFGNDQNSIPAYAEATGANAVTGVAVSSASPAVCTKTAHGFSEGQRIRFSGAAATLPSGGQIPFGSSCYAKNVAANTFQVSLTSGGCRHKHHRNRWEWCGRRNQSRERPITGHSGQILAQCPAPSKTEWSPDHSRRRAERSELYYIQLGAVSFRHFRLPEGELYRRQGIRPENQGVVTSIQLDRETIPEPDRNSAPGTAAFGFRSSRLLRHSRNAHIRGGL